MKDLDLMKTTVIDDKAALRAFVMPELFPFLLESYVKDGKTEETLREDIRKARECYKELVKVTRPKPEQNPSQADRVPTKRIRQ